MTMIVPLACVAIAAYALFTHARQIQKALENFSSRFGGPGASPPTHPLPGNDAFLVLRRRGKLAPQREQ